jgi:hypothetical protein
VRRSTAFHTMPYALRPRPARQRSAQQRRASAA